MPDFVVILAVASGAALASPLGGVIALWRAPTTLYLSLVLGFAGGVLLGTIAFQMIPQALESAGLARTAAGFAVGLGLVYVLDLYVNRWRVAGKQADQRKDVDRFHRRHRPRGDEVTVLAGATSAEELIEGLSIGVGAALAPGTGLAVAIAIAVDNVAEALAIGGLARSGGNDQREARWRTLKWTGLIGISLLGSAFVGWFFLRGLPQPILGFLFAVGAGAMFYLTVTDLVPDAEEQHYQQSAGLAIALGFLSMLVFAQLT